MHRTSNSTVGIAGVKVVQRHDWGGEGEEVRRNR